MANFFGSIIGLRPEFAERYIALHANAFPGVLQRISRSGIRNYSIFLDDDILFGYLEYAGDDYAGDMAAFGTDETTRQWWSLTDPMQAPLPERHDGEWWAQLPIWRAGAVSIDAHSSLRHAFVCPRRPALPPWPAVGPSSPGTVPGVLKARAFAAAQAVYVYIEANDDFYAEMFARELARTLGQLEPARHMREVFHTDGLDAAGR